MKVILTSDWHLREKTPISRTGSFWNDMWEKVHFISKLQKKYNCSVIHAGDLFDHWKPSPRLLSYTIGYLPDQFYTLYGNHDLPQHNLELKEMTGIYTLQQAGVLKVLSGCHWDREPNEQDIIVFGNTRFLVWHKFVYKPGKVETWQADIGTNAVRILRKYKDLADVIVTGDNHQSFFVKFGDKLLVNPGSMMRLTSQQKDFQPQVFLYDLETKEIELIPLPIRQDVWVQDIRHPIKQDMDVQAFISGLQGEFKSDLDYANNLRVYFAANKIPKRVQDYIWKTFN